MEMMVILWIGELYDKYGPLELPGIALKVLFLNLGV